MSVSPLIARQIPIREGEKVTGFVDVALERAYHYVPGKPSEPIALPDELSEREARARTQLLEQLADHDDNLLEQLLMDQVPEPGTIFADLQRETSDNLGVSVLFGSAQNGWGVRRLLKALATSAGSEATAARLGVDAPAIHALNLSWRLGRPHCPGPCDRRARPENTDFSSGDEHGRQARVRGPRRQDHQDHRSGQWRHYRRRQGDGVKAGDWLGAGNLPSLIDISLPSQLRVGNHPPTARTTSAVRCAGPHP
jgi:elongation factor G